jgi:single-strand DNA-binding protein
MNKALLVGRLTKDPELRTTPGGVAVTRFTIAISEPYTNKNGERETNFINCVAWGRQADNVSKYCKKGALVSAEGRIQTRSYDGQDGNKRYVTEVNCDRINFLTPKGDSQSNDYASSMPSNEEMANMAPDNNMDSVDLSEDPFKSFGEEITLSSDDLPF